jgi:hypothetical protein
MEHWIANVREPARLVLAWQAPDGAGDRSRRAVAEVRRLGSEAQLTYLHGTTDYDAAIKLGFEGYPAFKKETKVHQQGVMAALMRRLPPRTRADFDVYLRGLRITPFTPVSDFGLLAASEAKLPSDGFSLVDTLEGAEPPFQLVMEIAGYRHCAPDLTEKDLGAAVTFTAEPTNKVDHHAVMMMRGDKKLGYVNTLQAPHFKKLLQVFEVTAAIERLNGKPDRPRAFVFVNVKLR